MGKSKEQKTQEILNEILFGNSQNPKKVLGCHKIENGWIVCAFYPEADSLLLHDRRTKRCYTMESQEKGFFMTMIKTEEKPDYYLEAYFGEKNTIYEDPYRFSSSIRLEECLSFEHGEHTKMYEVLGSHYEEKEGILGTRFAVYAPLAGRVSVVGEWNKFNGLIHTMQKIDEGGIFELFIPEAAVGMAYQYEIKTLDGRIIRKADPYSRQQHKKKREYSIIVENEPFAWKDKKYIEERREKKEEPVLIYQVYPYCYKRKGKKENRLLTYRQLAKDLAAYAKSMGYTKIQLKGILESMTTNNLSGEVLCYYAPTSSFGSSEDFKYFINYLHQKGIGVYLEWKIGGFSMEEAGLACFDGTPLYEYENSKLAIKEGEQELLFNYGKPEVQSFLLSNARFWIEEYHIDGFFVEGLASMIYQDYGKIGGDWLPNEWGEKENIEAITWIEQCNTWIKKIDSSVCLMTQDNSGWSGVTEQSSRGGLNFDFQWNKEWLTKFMSYLGRYPSYRKYDFWKMYYETTYHFHSRNILTVSDRETVLWNGTLIQKMPGEYFNRFACLRVLYGFMMGYSGRKLFFMGEDFAHWHPCKEEKGLDWYLLEEDIHKNFHYYMKELMSFYREHPVLWKYEDIRESFCWYHTEEAEYGFFSFIRKSDNGKGNLLFCFSMRPEMGKGYLLTVPEKTEYHLVFHSDRSEFGGIGTGDLGIVIQPVSKEAEEIPHMIVDLPPLSMLVFEYDSE